MLTITYSYGTTNNNGDPLTETITPGAGQTPYAQSFTYDGVNRLKTAAETFNGSQSWQQVFNYDPYGNRWFDLSTSGTVIGPLTSQLDFSASNNRIVKAGYAYDAAGNLTTDGSTGKTFTYRWLRKSLHYTSFHLAQHG